jgi:RNA polymerase sigma-32 factor
MGSERTSEHPERSAAKAAGASGGRADPEDREDSGESTSAPDSATRLPALPVTEQAVEPSDALTQYMAQLRSYPPISREHEHELAVRWVEERDPEAARALVLANLRLVVKIAMEYRRAWINVLDLIQDGNVGLMEAVQRFDPYRGVKLSSYAVYWIRAYILKHIIDNHRMVRIGRSRAERKLFFRLNKERNELEKQGFAVQPKLLAERLDVTEEDVVQMQQRMGASDLSLNAPARRDDDGGTEVGDTLAIGSRDAEQQVGDEELRRVFLEKVGEFVESLDDRDRQIVEQRILAADPRTLNELGEEFGVSRERIRQLEVRLVERLREYMQEHMVDFEYYAAPGD